MPYTICFVSYVFVMSILADNIWVFNSIAMIIVVSIISALLSVQFGSIRGKVVKITDESALYICNILYIVVIL